MGLMESVRGHGEFKGGSVEESRWDTDMVGIV